MAYFLIVFCVAAGVVAATAWARSVVRRRPSSPTGVVLSSIDDRVLVGGILAGLAVTACTEFAAGSWMGRSWGTPIADSLQGQAASSSAFALLAGIPLLALLALSPLIVAVMFPAVALALSAHFAVRRGDSRPRPVVTAVASAAVSFTLNGPAAGSLSLGIAVAVISAVVRREPPVPDVATSLPGRLRLSDRHERSPRNTQQWELLNPARRYHAARISAVNIVMFMTVIVASSAVALLPIS